MVLPAGLRSGQIGLAETGQQRAGTGHRHPACVTGRPVDVTASRRWLPKKGLVDERFVIDIRRKSPPGIASRMDQQIGCNCCCSFVMAIIS
jgi:hypothetical protein